MRNTLDCCPCGSQTPYNDCCGIYHTGKCIAPTPEILMRSRYTAYAIANIDYIQKTMQGKPLINFNPIATTKWDVYQGPILFIE